MKKIILSLVLILTVSFAFASNGKRVEVSKEKSEISYNYTLDNIVDIPGACWATYTVTATNSDTGQEISWSMRVYVGEAYSYSGCVYLAAEFAINYSK